MAVWSRRLGSFAIPLLVIPVFMHRAGTLASETFMLIGMTALGFAALAVLLSLGAFVHLWRSGDHGWGRAVVGLLLGLVCLIPLGAAAYEYSRYPEATDVMTDPSRPVSLLVAESGETADHAAVLASFPNAVARDYRIGTNEAFRLVEALVAERGWEVVRRQPPQLESAEGRINAIETTWLGWRDEVAIRVTGDFLDTHVDMRSAAVFSMHDLGRNGKRVEDFLRTLDAAVIDAQRNRPAPDAPPVPAIQGGDG